VFEHLYRHHPIEAPLDREVVHVGGDHLDVGQAAPLGLADDPGPLRVRVRNEDRVAIGQFGVLAGGGKRRGFGLWRSAAPMSRRRRSAKRRIARRITTSGTSPCSTQLVATCIA
jgi:hypothetical protein